jgi:tRNA threonylcarbamoyladenosine biosynthesis protein TsaB
MILLLRADTKTAYIALLDGIEFLVKDEWQAGRELSLQLNQKIEAYCEEFAINLSDFAGIIVYKGPGSYTGLRITVAVANALGYAHNLKVAATSGELWEEDGVKILDTISGFTPVAPFYGGEVYTTKPIK